MDQVQGNVDRIQQLESELAELRKQFSIVAGMLDQHDRYEFGPVSVVRYAKTGPWYVYYRGLEVHALANPLSAPRPFPVLPQAVFYALDPKNQAEWARLRDGKKATGDRGQPPTTDH